MSYRFQPDNTAPLISAALQFEQAHEAEKALPLWRQVLALQPQSADVLASLGRVLIQTNQLQEADAHLQQALTVDAKHLNALLNRGVALHALERHAEAIAHYDQLLPLDLAYAKTALFNMGTIHQYLLDFEAAHACFQRLLMLEPGHLGAHACWLFGQHYAMSPPLTQITERARQFGLSFAASQPLVERWMIDADESRPLRIGVVSADLRDHPVGYFLESMLGTKAARGLQWIAYSNSRFETALSERIKPLFEEWRRVLGWTDDAVAKQIVEDRIDVLIDLSGFTTGQRLAVFARRPAPVQISWLGYFGTTGMPFFDAVLADPHSVPAPEAAWFVEPVVHLPDTRFCFTPPPDAPAVAPLPALNNGFVTFGCFQDIAKINDAVLSLWGHIAQAAPSARFRMQRKRLEPGSVEQIALLARMQAAGINGDQVSFHGEVPRVEYLAAHAEVDVVLDTFPYPGGTTTTEALWMGVPTLTLATPGMLGRQGEQLMTAAGLPAWIVHDEAAYVAKAVALASPAQWPALAEQRAAFRECLAVSPLFDNERFARDWSRVVRGIWQTKIRQLVGATQVTSAVP
jgi:protein O-GlcNAc transferase